MKKVFKTIALLLLSAVLAISVFACENVKNGSTDSDNNEIEFSKTDEGSVDGGTSVVPPSDGSVHCGEVADGDYHHGYTEKIGYADAIGGMPSGGKSFGDFGDYGYGEAVGGSDEGRQNDLPAGQITASACNDNEEYEYFLSLFTQKTVVTEQGDNGQEGTAETVDGKFYERFNSDRWGFDATKRVTVNVVDGANKVSGAVVEYRSADNALRYALTDANGVAYIFPDTAEGTVGVYATEAVFAAAIKGADAGVCYAEGAFNAENRVVTVDVKGSKPKENVIKLMFVVDVTGSMGDEIEYLGAELADVIRRVAANNDGVRIDLALLFYRDDGDEEKFAYSDFVTVTDEVGLASQMRNLKKQYASGGGDYPEALDEALYMAVDKDWGDENATRILFQIYDAPPHSEEKNKTCYEEAVRLAAKKGIRVNPVLCSGADELCEYLAREAAVHTQGHFVYVTDDSGIGGSHYDPDIPDAVVEKLNELIIRLVDGYHTGTFAPAVPWQGESADSDNQ